MLFLLSMSWCFLIILLSEISRNEIKYDCRNISYPLAINMPLKTIQLCENQNGKKNNNKY